MIRNSLPALLIFASMVALIVAFRFLNAGQAPGGRQHTSSSTSCEGQGKVLSRM